MYVAIFPPHLSKVPYLPQKSDAGSYEVLRLSRKIILANRSERVVFYILTLRCASRHNGVRFFNKSTCKSAPDVFHILTWKFASHQSRVHFFDTSFSKSARSMRCLYHFHFDLCFRATAACNFWSRRTKWLRTRRFIASRLFDPSEPRKIGKRQRFVTFLPFRPPWPSFYWLVLLWLFPSLIFFLLTSAYSLFSDSFSSLTVLTPVAASVHKLEVWLLNFLRLLTIGSCLENHTT